MKNFVWFVVLSLVLGCSFAVFAQEPPAPPAEQPPAAQPAPVKDPMLARYENTIKQAETAIADKKYSDALRALGNLDRRGKGQELPAEISAKRDELKKQIDTAIEATLKDAEAKLATDPVAAILALQDVQGMYGSESAKKATETINKFRKENAEAYQKATKEINASNQLKNIPRMLEIKQYLQATNQLENIMKNYAGTKSAAEAEAKLKELQGNPEIQKAVDEEKDKNKQNEFANALNTLASTYLRHGDKEEAKKYLNMIKEKYPKSNLAGNVENMIKNIDNPAPAKAAGDEGGRPNRRDRGQKAPAPAPAPAPEPAPAPAPAPAPEPAPAPAPEEPKAD